MTGPFALIVRVFLRYLAGALVAKGAIDLTLANEITGDPALIELLSGWLAIAWGALIGAISEAWRKYVLRRGGKT